MLRHLPTLAIPRPKAFSRNQPIQESARVCNIVGGAISPILANAYLHYVLDDRFYKEVRPRLTGQVFLIRYAVDFVIGFTDEQDARRVKDVLYKRFGKYGLAIHPDKTRLVRALGDQGGATSLVWLGLERLSSSALRTTGASALREIGWQNAKRRLAVSRERSRQSPCGVDGTDIARFVNNTRYCAKNSVVTLVTTGSPATARNSTAFGRLSLASGTSASVDGYKSRAPIGSGLRAS